MQTRAQASRRSSTEREMRNSTGATDQIQQELATTLSSRTFDDSREELVGTDEPITHQETEGGKRAQGVDLEGNRQNKLRHDDKPESWRPDVGL